MIKKIISLILALSIAMTLCACGGKKSTGKKWSDLSPIEKENARWAYHVREALNGK